MESRQPQIVQTAAIRTLASFSSEEVARLLLDSYPGLTPTVRSEAVEALLARPERLVPLLEAIEARKVSLAQIPLSRRTLLMKHADPAIRDFAVKLFSADAPVRERKCWPGTSRPYPRKEMRARAEGLLA